jgi:CO/xanthine dehydrogenase Mo-binding subunit
MAAEYGHVVILEKLWYFAKELQLKQDELRNEVLLSKDEYNQTAWHKAAGKGEDQLLEKLWAFAHELQLKPDKLKNDVLSKNEYNRTA